MWEGQKSLPFSNSLKDKLLPTADLSGGNNSRTINHGRTSLEGCNSSELSFVHKANLRKVLRATELQDPRFINLSLSVNFCSSGRDSGSELIKEIVIAKLLTRVQR